MYAAHLGSKREMCHLVNALWPSLGRRGGLKVLNESQQRSCKLYNAHVASARVVQY